MQNCLRYDTGYLQAAWLGQLAIFSIQASASRATLSMSEQTHSGEVIKYEAKELEGMANEQPSAQCRIAALSLVKYLNDRLPLELPGEESERREHVRTKLSSQSLYNSDRATANDIWRHYYSPTFPKRFRQISAEQVALQYYNERE